MQVTYWASEGPPWRKDAKLLACVALVLTSFTFLLQTAALVRVVNRHWSMFKVIFACWVGYRRSSLWRLTGVLVVRHRESERCRWRLSFFRSQICVVDDSKLNVVFSAILHESIAKEVHFVGDFWGAVVEGESYTIGIILASGRICARCMHFCDSRRALWSRCTLIPHLLCAPQGAFLIAFLIWIQGRPCVGSLKFFVIYCSWVVIWGNYRRPHTPAVLWAKVPHFPTSPVHSLFLLPKLILSYAPLCMR